MKEPQNIDELVQMFYQDIMPDDNFVSQVKSTSTTEFATAQQNNLGVFIRQMFILKPTPIKDYCISLGLNIPEDMSELILEELHKFTTSKLNNTAYKFEYKKKVYPSMNMYALEGHKVKVTTQTLANGTDEDIKLVDEHLSVNYKYTVEKTVVRESSSDVYLKEREGIRFNTCNFEDVSPQSEGKDRMHPDYGKFNS